MNCWGKTMSEIGSGAQGRGARIYVNQELSARWEPVSSHSFPRASIGKFPTYGNRRADRYPPPAGLGDNAPVRCMRLQSLGINVRTSRLSEPCNQRRHLPCPPLPITQRACGKIEINKGRKAWSHEHNLIGSRAGLNS